MKNSLIGFLFCLFLIAAVAASRKPLYADANLYITSGTCVTSSNGTVTNTFPSAYSSAPTIITTQVGTTTTGTNLITSVTTTNFILTTRNTPTTNNWIAIGTP